MYYNYFYHSWIFIIIQYPSLMAEVRKTQMRFFVNPILKKFQKIIFQYPQIQNKIYECLSNLSQPSLQSFINCLQKECGITTKIIIQIVRQLTKNKDVQKILKQNLIKCWIKCEIYSLRKFDKDKRQKIADVFDHFQFKGSSLNQLVIVSLNAVNEKISIQEMIKLKQTLLKDNSDKIKSLFSQQITLPTISQDPNKNIPQRLEDMLNDYDFFPPNSLEKHTNKPDSLQKQIEKELIISFVQMHSLSSKLQRHKLKGLHNQIGQLQAKIIRHGQRNAKTQQLIKNLKASSTPNERYILLSALKSRLFGINVLQLQRLISYTVHSKHKLKDKHAILLLGSTGSGKTTTILKLLGYKLKKVAYKGLETLIPQNLKQQHKTFVASPQCTSITRYLNVAEVPEEMYSRPTYRNKRNYCLVDSPGFFDTSGIQVEIANKIGVLTGLSQCISLVILIIIPYETITADRGQGLINTSEAISKFFKDFEESKSSILFMFNKVPQDNIHEIPIRIESKIDNLSHGQNRDIINSILSRMMLCSKEKINFIFPTQTKLSLQETNFKDVLERLFNMDKIVYPKQALKSGLTKSMMNEVKTYSLNKKQRVQYCMEEGKINEAKFYYDLIAKMKNIFETDDFLNEIHQKLENYFKKKNEVWLQNISKGMQILVQNKMNTQFIANLKQNRTNLLQFAHYFNKDDYSKQLQVMVTSQKQQFHQLFIIQKTDDYNLFEQIKLFSSIFMPGLLDEFAEMIQKQLLKQFKSINCSIEIKKIQQLSQNIPILLKSIKIYNNLKKSVEIQQKLNSIINGIEQLFDNYLKQIKQLINDKKLVIADRFVTLISTNFVKIKQLQSLKIIKKIDTKKQINSFLRSYQSRFKQTLTNSQNLMNELLLQKQPQQLKMLPSAQIKQIKAMLKQIFMNLNFEPLSKQFNEEVRHVKQQILYQLDNGLNRLISYIQNIKNDKIKNMKDKLGYVKNNYNILLKVCEIIQEKRPIQQINSIISEKIMEIVQYLAKLIDLFEVKFSPLLMDNIQKAKQYFQTILSLQSLNDISHQLSSKIKQIRCSFIKRLQLPFCDFQQFIHKSLTISNEYIFSSLTFEKIQRFCLYSLELSKILSHKDRSSNPHEYNIEQKFQSFMIELKNSIYYFIEATFHDSSKIRSMKQYIRSIINLNQKQHTKIYLSNTIGIQTAPIIQAIRYKLDDIINQITKQFEDLRSKSLDISEILTLTNQCKKYIIIEEVISIKKERLYLKELLESINDYMSNHINIVKETAIFHIKGNKPSNINFYQVNIINQKLTLLNNAEGNEKKMSIYNQIRNIQRQILGLLNNIRKEMGKQIQEENINRHQFAEYFQSFNEAIILEKQLNKLYNKTKKFEICNSIQETAKIIISYFENLYYNIREYFQQYRLKKISKTINAIAFIQYQINEQEYFNPQQDQEQIQTNRQQLIKNLRQFTNTAILQIKNQIDSFGQSSIVLSSVSFSNVNLLRYLQIWQQKLQQYLQNRYCQQSGEFKPDERFKLYYLNNLMDPRQINTYQLQQKKYQADKNIKSYFGSLQQTYKESSVECRKIIQKQWQDSLYYVPSIIRQEYKLHFKELRQSVSLQNNLSSLLVDKAFSVERDEEFEEIVAIFTNQYYEKNEDSFLQEVQRSGFFGNKCLMLKKGIDLQAFSNQMSQFFIEINQSSFFVRRFKKQLKQNQKIIDQFLKNYQLLQNDMKNNQIIPTLKKKLSFW